MTFSPKAMKKAAAFGAAAAFLAATPALGWTAYEVRTGGYAVICADGTVFGYRGQRVGLSVDGPALCAGRGGFAGDNAGSSEMRVVEADHRFSHVFRYCMQRSSRPARATSGTARRLTCELEIYPDGSSGRSHNTSRSNVRG
ncbi:MAG: hypothetical protein JJT95_10475 [Pararhodobacter sp.]|nr:hypothetical protein [Pararhodobacter sp.]